MHLVGGGSSSGGPNGAVNLPDNLRNTTWTNQQGCTLIFKVYTIHFYLPGDNTEDPRDDNEYGVFAASENGEIKTKMGDEGVWKYMETAVLCSSYSINGNELRLNFPPDARANYTDHYIQQLSEEYDEKGYLGYSIWTRKE